MKDTLQSRASGRGWGFRTIAVVQTLDAEQGVRYVRRFGTFHEIVSGGAWYNTGIRMYVLEDLRGKAATPQVVVTLRLRAAPAERSVLREDVMVRKIGVESIESWYVHGMKLPAMK